MIPLNRCEYCINLKIFTWENKSLWNFCSTLHQGWYLTSLLQRWCFGAPVCWKTVNWINSINSLVNKDQCKSCTVHSTARTECAAIIWICTRTSWPANCSTIWKSSLTWSRFLGCFFPAGAWWSWTDLII